MHNTMYMHMCMSIAHVHVHVHALKAYEPRSGASYARLPCYEQNEQT